MKKTSSFNFWSFYAVVAVMFFVMIPMLIKGRDISTYTIVASCLLVGGILLQVIAKLVETRSRR